MCNDTVLEKLDALPNTVKISPEALSDLKEKMEKRRIRPEKSEIEVGGGRFLICRDKKGKILSITMVVQEEEDSPADEDI